MFNQLFQRGNRCPPALCRSAGRVPAALSRALRGARTRAVDAPVDRETFAGSGAVLAGAGLRRHRPPADRSHGGAVGRRTARPP